MSRVDPELLSQLKGKVEEGNRLLQDTISYDQWRRWFFETNLVVELIDPHASSIREDTLHSLWAQVGYHGNIVKSYLEPNVLLKRQIEILKTSLDTGIKVGEDSAYSHLSQKLAVHSSILKSGVEIWNTWRKDNPNIRPWLDKAELWQQDLIGANLSGASINSAYCLGVNLEGANLEGATLCMADLTRAKLSDANLARVSLSGATLTGTNLSGANLKGADLTGTVIRDVCLRGADLTDASFGPTLMGGTHGHETILSNTDLTGAKGLELCTHWGNSIVDHRTLQKSGTLPQAFLRGCGLPDSLIDYLPSLFKESFQFYSCFISYSSFDEDFARRLYADLQTNSIRCWYAPQDMKIGDQLRHRIDKSILVYDKLLLILSKHALNSVWVGNEVEAAFDKEMQTKSPVLFPIRLDNTVLESKIGWAANIRRTRNIGDFSSWKSNDEYKKAFAQLLRDLRAEGT